MISRPLSIAVGVMWGLLAVAAPAAEGPTSLPALRAQVLQIFTDKCTQCHAPELARPKGDFGYVTDLDQVAKWYIGKAKEGQTLTVEQTTLWQVLQDPVKPMPPRKAKAGPLSEAELATIQAWIAGVIAADATGAAGAVEAGSAVPATTDGASGGAKAPSPPTVTAPAGHAAQPKPATSVPAAGEGHAETAGAGFTVARFVARLHPVFLHFPIALLIVAALAELLAMIRPFGEAHHPGRFCALLGAISSWPAALSGWLMAADQGYTEATVALHRWLGVGLAGLAAVVFAVCVLRALRSTPQVVWLYRIVLWGAALLAALTGHFGGSIVRAENIFMW